MPTVQSAITFAPKLKNISPKFITMSSDNYVFRKLKRQKEEYDISIPPHGREVMDMQ